MFFILSKLLYFLLNPVNWVLAGLIGWLVFRKWKRRKQVIWITLIIFYIFSNSYLYKAVVLAWQPPVVTLLPTQHCRAAILLGGMTYSNKKKEMFFGGTADRFIQAARLYYTGYAGKIILSGGDGSIKQDRPKEALFIQAQMHDLQIPDSNIIVEANSRNTYENAVNCKRILDSMSIKSPVFLITSAIHMRRAVACYKKQGIQVEPFASNYEAVENPFSISALLIPDLNTISRWHALIKEMIGLQVYKWSGKAS